MSFDELPLFAKNAYRAARQRATTKRLDMMSEAEFFRLWIDSRGQCALSGLRFSSDEEHYESSTGYGRLSSRPWEPSLDQISAGHGYSVKNSQLVCKCVNIGKSGYSSETFERWVLATAKMLASKRVT